MYYKGKRGILEGLRVNNSKIAKLLLAGAIVLGTPSIVNVGEDYLLEEYRNQLNMEEEVPEVPYVNEYGVEITKETYERLQREKKLKIKRDSEDWER